jgi:polar amino acid transport system substrate-binding protein
MVKPERVGQPIRTLGIIIGFQPWKYKDEIKAGRIRVTDAPGTISLIQMILSERVDGGNLALEVARYHLTQMGKPKALVADPKLIPLVESHYHLSSIRYPELVSRFDLFLQKEQKAVKALQEKYGF